MLYDARLDKDDDSRVLCGAPDCTEQLATALGDSARPLFFGRGWQCSEREGFDVWRLSRTSRVARHMSAGRADQATPSWGRRETARHLPCYVICPTRAGHRNVVRPVPLRLAVWPQ